MSNSIVIDEYKCKNYESCGGMIVFTERDQEYYVQNNFVNPDGSITKPKFCKPCRIKRKIEKEKNKHGR